MKIEEAFAKRNSDMRKHGLSHKKQINEKLNGKVCNKHVDTLLKEIRKKMSFSATLGFQSTLTQKVKLRGNLTNV